MSDERHLSPLPDPPPRIDNDRGGEHCTSCDETAHVVVGTEPTSTANGGSYDVEVMGPCPTCERGYRLEFGMGRDKDGKEYVNPQGGPWGRDGYWQGRTWTPVEAA